MNKSKRAKRNMTDQLKSQLSFYQNTIIERRNTITKIKSYAKYKLPGYQQTLARELTGLFIIRKDLANLKARILKRQKAGEIYKVL